MIETERNDKGSENSDANQENLSDLETEFIRKSLASEILDLEHEFRLAKDILYSERVNNIDLKLSQARSGKSPEFLKIASIIDEACKIKCQILKSRRDFSLEVANNEFDIQNQTLLCDAKEFLQNFEFDLKESINAKLSRLIVTKKFQTNDSSCGHDFDCLAYDSDNEVPLPGIDLENRKRPVTLSPDQAYIIYNLDQEDIDQDIAIIMNSIREHEIEKTREILTISPDSVVYSKN